MGSLKWRGREWVGDGLDQTAPSLAIRLTPR